METEDPTVIRQSQIITVVTILVSIVVFLNWGFIAANISDPTKIFSAGLAVLFPHGVLWLIALFGFRFILMVVMGYELAIVSLQPLTSLNIFSRSTTNFVEYVMRFANIILAFGIFFIAFIIGRPL